MVDARDRVDRSVELGIHVTSDPDVVGLGADEGVEDVRERVGLVDEDVLLGEDANGGSDQLDSDVGHSSLISLEGGLIIGPVNHAKNLKPLFKGRIGSARREYDAEGLVVDVGGGIDVRPEHGLRHDRIED